MAPLKTLAGAAALGLLTQGCVIVAGDFDGHDMHGDHPDGIVVLSEAAAPVSQRLDGSRGDAAIIEQALAEGADDRALDFTRVVLAPGAEFAPRRVDTDRVYYVLEGEAIATADGASRRLQTGEAAYAYKDTRIVLRPAGSDGVTLIVTGPLKGRE